jgi:hypothetical protein
MGRLFQTTLVATILLAACTSKKQSDWKPDAHLQNECVHRLSDVIVYDIFNPPVASRIYAYSNLAYYEALKWKKEGTPSITAGLKGFEAMPAPEKSKGYDFDLAAVEAFYTVVKALTFSKDSSAKTKEALLAKFEASLEKDVYVNSIVLGDTVAKTILKRAGSDYYKITRGMPKYSVFRQKEGEWVQTPPDYADGVEPNWRLLHPLLLDSAAQFKPEPPPPYSMNQNSRYYQELMEVWEVSKNIDKTRDTIAHYWDDNPFVTEHHGHLSFATKKTTPGGHWMGIVNILCRQSKADEITTAKAYVLTAAAMFDGFISCWDEKYRSKMVRPVTVIREKLDPNWNPFLQTPPFPEYTSGHSVVSGAAYTVLESIFGTNTSFHDTTEKEYLALERSFPSIHAAAEEACISRLYGGIHFRAAIEEGKKQGENVGKWFVKKFN